MGDKTMEGTNRKGWPAEVDSRDDTMKIVSAQSRAQKLPKDKGQHTVKDDRKEHRHTHSLKSLDCKQILIMTQLRKAH